MGAFAVLWSAIAEWASPATCAVCRAGRAAAAAARAKMLEDRNYMASGSACPDGDGTAEKFTTPTPGDDRQKPEALAGAVAAAAEREARVSAPIYYSGRDPKAGVNEHTLLKASDSTSTDSLRHSGLSAMVNRHLGQAAAALEAAAADATTEGKLHTHHSPWRLDSPSSSQVWVWSADREGKRPGNGAGGQWLEVGRMGNRSGSGTTDLQNADDRAAGTRGTSAEAGGAEHRRAIAAVVDTFHAERSSAAVDLSIAQWKALTMVMLATLGLAGLSIESGHRTREGEGLSGPFAEEGVVGAQACSALCGPEVNLSAREFELLCEALCPDA